MGNKQTAEMGKEQISTSKTSLKLCLPLAVVLLATAIPLVGANTVAGFVLGAQNTNVCPAGSVSIGTAEECESAATAMIDAGQAGTWQGSSSNAYLPIECILRADVYFFNTHETGRASMNAILICASIPSNEPTSMPSISNEPTSMPSNEPTSMPSNEPTAYVQGPISTTCYDLKSSYQNNSCCSQDTGKPATFNGTAVTCGNVLASYKSSECCSADEAKNATMIFNVFG